MRHRFDYFGSRALFSALPFTGAWLETLGGLDDSGYRNTPTRRGHMTATAGVRVDYLAFRLRVYFAILG